MELMSSMLLFALVLYFPNAMGDKFPDSGTKMKLNETSSHNQGIQHKKVLHSPSDSAIMNSTSELQSVFMDSRCKKCVHCMARAVQKYKKQAEMKANISISELEGEIISTRHESKNRIKRDDNTITTSAVSKKNKSKKKPTKAVTVTKYNIDGEVYGLKIKETKLPTGDYYETESSSCRIYSVKKSYECDTPESESFLASKKKVNKKSKKEKEKEKSTTVSTTAQAYISSPSFRKRQVDPAEMPENLELSMEDIY